MIDLQQGELQIWQKENFPRERYEVMSKKELIDMILILQMALGMAEEVGEICHHVLKGSQKIRGGVNGMNVAEVADGVADTSIYGTQLLSELNINAESNLSYVTEKVLARNWNADPEGNSCKPGT